MENRKDIVSYEALTEAHYDSMAEGPADWDDSSQRMVRDLVARAAGGEDFALFDLITKAREVKAGVTDDEGKVKPGYELTKQLAESVLAETEKAA